MNFLKNIAAGLISLTMLSSVSVGASSVPYLQGDIDYDEAVTLSDAVYLKNFLSGNKCTMDNAMTQRLDVNLDGHISQVDVDIVSGIVLNGTSPEIQYYNTNSNEDLPNSERLRYRKFNAQTGGVITNYTLEALDSIPVETSYYEDEPMLSLNPPSCSVVKITSSLGNALGIIVDNHTILTSADAVYNRNNFTEASNISYIVCGQLGENITGSISALYYHVPYKYTAFSATKPNEYQKYNYAIITTSENLNGYGKASLGVIRKYLPVNNSFTWSLSNNFSSNLNMLTGTLNNVNEEFLYHNLFTSKGSPIRTNGNADIIGIATGDNYGKRIDSNVLSFVFNNTYLP